MGGGAAFRGAAPPQPDLKGNLVALSAHRFDGLEKSEAIDRRYSERHPNRSAWLRPATAEERAVLFEGDRIPRNFSACLAIVLVHTSVGPVYQTFKFISTSRDVEASDASAVKVALAAAQALSDGQLLRIRPRRAVHG